MDKEELKPLQDVFLATINGIEYLVARNNYRTQMLTDVLRNDGEFTNNVLHELKVIK